MTKLRLDNGIVSTHSRPKAAEWTTSITRRNSLSFNTQPPEGGCLACRRISSVQSWFQHTAARRRLQILSSAYWPLIGFNTQPPEGGCRPLLRQTIQPIVSTHSRPKAAGRYFSKPYPPLSFNTQPPEGGCHPSGTELEAV